MNPGLPFRETHHIAGQVVALAEKEVPMDHLTLDQLQSVDPRFDEHALKVFDYEHSVERKTAAGGTSRSVVEKQIQDVRAYLENP
jgi:argininosuccinate lyase